MKKYIGIVVALVGCILTACTKTEFQPVATGKPNELPVTVSLAPAPLSRPASGTPATKAVAREDEAFAVTFGEPETKGAVDLTSSEDSKIYNLWAIQYRADGTLVGSPYYLNSVSNPGAGVPGSADATYSVPLNLTANAETGGKVYFIANTNSATLFNTSNVATESALNNMTQAITSQWAPTAGTGVPMLGVYTGAVSSAGLSSEVILKRLVAKVVFRYKVNPLFEGFTLSGIRLRNVTSRMYFCSEPTAVFPAQATGSHLDYSVENLANAGTDGDYKTFTWYIPENLRGVNDNVGGYYDRTHAKTDGNATFVEIKGSLKGGLTKLVTYDVLLGDPNTNVGDFNVKRNTLYTVTIDIQGADIADNRVTVEEINIGDIATKSTLANAYVGAFWRADQTGERIIRIPVSVAASAGPWSASILSADGNWPADLALFSTTASTDGGITWNATTENPADMIDNDAAYQVTDGAASVSGTVTNGGTIYFRIGLKSTYTPTEEAPVRYAVVQLTYGTPEKYHLIFLRQGHDPDYVMRPSDPVNSGGMNSSTRPDAKRFSPYNLTSPGYNPDPAGTQVAVGGGVFARYPSQAGAFFQWAGTTGKERLAYPAIGGVSWSISSAAGYWSTLAATHETCPAGYTLSWGTQVDFRRPNDGTTTGANTTWTVSGSEMRQSIWLNPRSGTTSNINNSVYGYYADGFFDRRAIVTSANNIVNSTVSYYTPETDARNADVAYIGRLFFNPNNNASLFLQAMGNRLGSNYGSMNGVGSLGCYWTASANYSTDSWRLDVSSSSAGISAEGNTRSSGNSVRCVRP